MTSNITGISVRGIVNAIINKYPNISDRDLSVLYSQFREAHPQVADGVWSADDLESFLSQQSSR